ncbi:MAG: hypothetical protein QM723_37590 [Myxococcaceae bacterium]
MTDLSCRGYEALWMSGLELWEIICGAHAQGRRYGGCELTDDECRRLVALAHATGGWLQWLAGATAVEAVSFDAWCDVYAAARGRPCPPLPSTNSAS